MKLGSQKEGKRREPISFYVHFDFLTTTIVFVCVAKTEETHGRGSFGTALPIPA